MLYNILVIFSVSVVTLVGLIIIIGLISLYLSMRRMNRVLNDIDAGHDANKDLLKQAAEATGYSDAGHDIDLCPLCPDKPPYDISCPICKGSGTIQTTNKRR